MRDIVEEFAGAGEAAQVVLLIDQHLLDDGFVG
jgi:hypothetical protein